MSNALKMAAAGGASAPLYADDVFSAFTYTGNGASQTITNGIDLAGEGGMVWIKSRGLSTVNHLYDTQRTATKYLVSNLTDAEATDANGLTSFSSSGFSIGSSSPVNFNTYNFVSWTFRQAPKFFDVVTYSGNSSTQTISHSLGQAPGMIITKNTTGTANWRVYHRSNGAQNYLTLDSTVQNQSSAAMFPTTPTATEFYLGNTDNNSTGSTYVAYLFAHDTGTDGLIQAGTFAPSGGDGTVTLGWEAQFVLVKPSDGTGDWRIYDNSRTFANTTATNNNFLAPNSSAAETSSGSLWPTATGFAYRSLVASSNYIYLAIRRPNKPPTSGTQVYNAIARTGTGAAATVTGVGFAPSLLVSTYRPAGNPGTAFYDRLRGALLNIQSNAADAEVSRANTVTSFDMDGVTLGSDALLGSVNGVGNIIHHFFKRAPGVFDEVCYAGTGSAVNLPHQLNTTSSELMCIVKSRSTTWEWATWHSDLDITPGITSGSGLVYLNTTAAAANALIVSCSGTELILTNNGQVNQSSQTYVAYLFATKAGISKVGSYTGNGSTQTISCGFTTGARFVLIKRTDSTGDWKVIDSVRGLVAGNDPTLALNSTAAEVTGTDCVDPDSSGFSVVQEATNNLNVNTATYIFLAFS